MDLLRQILLGVFILLAVSMVVLILLQRGKGSDLGAVFGGGSQSVFGSRGSANFLTRITAVLAVLFFGTALGLAFISTGDRTVQSVTQSVVEPQTGGAESNVADTPSVPESPDAAEVPQVPE